VTNAKPSSETTQDKENTVSLCSSKKNDIEKCANLAINYQTLPNEASLLYRH